MGQAASRNAPCPCGSGKKYKHCCWGKPEAPATTRWVLPAIFCALAVAAGIWVGITKGIGLGFATAAAGLIVIGLVIAFRQPPPSAGGKSDPAAINFGK